MLAAAVKITTSNIQHQSVNIAGVASYRVTPSRAKTARISAYVSKRKRKRRRKAYQQRENGVARKITRIAYGKPANIRLRHHLAALSAAVMYASTVIYFRSLFSTFILIVVSLCLIRDYDEHVSAAARGVAA